jgi:hypothetical protein
MERKLNITDIIDLISDSLFKANYLFICDFLIVKY